MTEIPKNTPKKIPGVPDIEDMQKWWEMREEIEEMIDMCHDVFCCMDRLDRAKQCRAVYDKIEALEPKKEGDG